MKGVILSLLIHKKRVCMSFIYTYISGEWAGRAICTGMNNFTLYQHYQYRVICIITINSARKFYATLLLLHCENTQFDSASWPLPIPKSNLYQVFDPYTLLQRACVDHIQIFFVSIAFVGCNIRQIYDQIQYLGISLKCIVSYQSYINQSIRDIKEL